MRCPKCGYITFDNLEVCLKCNKDIAGASELLQGGVQKVAAPMFLNLQPDVETDQGDEQDMFADDLDTDDEYIDPDLDVLIGEDSSDDIGLEIEMDEDDDSEFEISMDDDDDDDEMEIELDSESDEVEIDFNQFEEEISLDGDDGIEVVAKESEPKLESELEIEIEMPDELMDMSDLDPPALAEESESFLDSPASLSAEEPTEEAEDLGGLDFDLGLDSLVEDEAGEILVEKETVVALDDIDFSDTLSGAVAEKGADSGNIGMDDDLNFDLDLGGISIHKDV